MGTAIKHPVPDRVKPSSFTKLRAEHQECPDVKNYKWRLNPFRMVYSCTHMTTVGVNGLNPALLNSTQLICYCVARSLDVVWTCETSVSAVLILQVVQTSTMHSTAEFSRQTTLRFSPHYSPVFHTMLLTRRNIRCIWVQITLSCSTFRSGVLWLFDTFPVILHLWFMLAFCNMLSCSVLYQNRPLWRLTSVYGATHS